MKFADLYPLYVAKVERKDRTETELQLVIEWLTGFSPADIASQIEKNADIREFFERRN